MKSFLHAGLLLSPLIVFWEAAGAGQPVVGSIAGALGAAALAFWSR